LFDLRPLRHFCDKAVNNIA